MKKNLQAWIHREVGTCTGRGTGLCRSRQTERLRPGHLRLRSPPRQPRPLARSFPGETCVHIYTYTSYTYTSTHVYTCAGGSQSAPRLGRPRRRSHRRNRPPGLRGRGAPPPAAQRAGGRGRRSGSHPVACRLRKAAAGGSGRWARVGGSGRHPRPPLRPRAGGDSAEPTPRPPGMRRGRARLPRGKLKAGPPRAARPAVRGRAAPGARGGARASRRRGQPENGRRGFMGCSRHHGARPQRQPPLR